MTAAVPLPGTGAVVYEHELRNSLRVLIVERHLDPVVAVMTWYGVGARNEREDEAGVSHFLEHMMFKGTRAHGKGEVDRITTRLGGSNNAYTSYDHTAYWFEMAADRWEEALALEADRMRGLLFDPVEFESEKAVVLEELSMGNDDPWRSLARQVQEVLFGRHPYARPIIGYPDVLARMTPELMRDYYRRFYTPANATLVLCGDVKPSKAMKAVRAHFGGLASGARGADAYRPPLAEPTGERRVRTTWDDNAARLVMAWPTAPATSQEDYVLDVVSTLLAGGRLARLHRRLVLDERIATYVQASNDARAEGGALWLYAEASAGVDLATLEVAIDDELGRLARELVPAAELKRTKATIAAGQAYEGETVTDVAEHVGEYAVDFEWREVLAIPSKRAAIRARDVRDVVRRLLAPERRVVGWSLPREGSA